MIGLVLVTHGYLAIELIKAMEQLPLLRQQVALNARQTFELRFSSQATLKQIKKALGI